jgi:hypothetical protein
MAMIKFLVRGIRFDVYLGQLPDEVKRECILNSKRHVVYAGPRTWETVTAFNRLAQTARISRSVQKIRTRSAAKPEIGHL